MNKRGARRAAGFGGDGMVQCDSQIPLGAGGFWMDKADFQYDGIDDGLDADVKNARNQKIIERVFFEKIPKKSQNFQIIDN